MAGNSFYEVLSRAIADFSEHGFDSADRLAFWQDQLRRSAERNMKSTTQLHETFRNAMRAVFRRLVERGGVLKYHRRVERFMLERIKPQLRAELERRIFASADLIKLNRNATIEKTLQRFSGWASSIPAGGSEAVNKTQANESIRKGLVGLPFEERRVLVDQSHKLSAAISHTMAQGSGAIAGMWRSNYRQPGYNYREDHKERDGEVFLLRGNWAQEKGFVKPSAAGYYDEVTAAAEEPFCRCYIVWLYALRDLPSEMLTAKGKEILAKTRVDEGSLNYRMDAEFRESEHPRDPDGRFTSAPGPFMDWLRDPNSRELSVEEMQTVAAETVREMGYDGSKVRVTTEERTFTLGDKVLDYAGAAYLHGERKGDIDIHYTKVNRAFLGELLAHEVMHQKWQAVWEAYQAETSRMASAEVRAGRDLIKPSGELYLEFADEFPIYAAIEPMIRGGNWQKLVEDDGVTPYSTAWWDEWKKGKAQTMQAFHETLAEISALYFKSGQWDKYRQIKGVSRLWMTLYHRIVKTYAEHVKK